MASKNYESTGVDYGVLDAAKRVAQRSAAKTEIKHGYGGAFTESRGESAFVFHVNGSSTLATVLECLGTKSVVAREYMEASGKNCFFNVGYDAVAAIVNDLISVGALPLVLNAYFATGSAEWYRDKNRYEQLVAGWSEACLNAGAVWGGGESPTLAGLVSDVDIEIAGSAVGFVPHRAGEEGHPAPILGNDLKPGDEIVFVESAGLHANGASLVRAIAPTLPNGYRTHLPSGREFGEAALDKSFMYVELASELRENDVDVTYFSHITGHGLRKVMRADKTLTYRISEMNLPVPEVLKVIADASDMDATAAYGTLNMGVGLAVYCSPGQGNKVVEIASEVGLNAELAGLVEDGPRQVILEPLGVVFDEHELQLRNTSPSRNRAKALSNKRTKKKQPLRRK